MTVDWYYRIMGVVSGPVDFSRLRTLALDGEIERDTFVRHGDGEWVTADQVSGVFHIEDFQVPEPQAAERPVHRCPHCGSILDANAVPPGDALASA